MSGGRSDRIHASTVALDGRAVVIRGAPGSGKSDLALRLIDAGAILVADDQTVVERRGSSLLASAPATIRGRIEIRGLGIVDVAHAGPTPVALLVDLAPAASIPRMPAAGECRERLMGIELPRFALDPTLPGAVARIRAALAHFGVVARCNIALVSPGEQC